MANLRERLQIPTGLSGMVVVVTDDGSRTLKQLPSGVTWHSESGALAESYLVYLENSAVADRLRNRHPTRVLEIGFGTGLNFWITASLALRHQAALEYHSFEPQLLPAEILALLEHDQLPDCQPAIGHFLPVLLRGPQESDSNAPARFGAVELHLHRCHFSHQQTGATGTFAAIYHDPFSPDSAPQLWTLSVFQLLHTLLEPGGKLVTYCVKSGIQRLLRSVGFSVSKTRGPVGGKREVLCAEKS